MNKITLGVIAASGGAAGYNWLVTANDIATLVVTIIAGVGGLAAGLYQYERWRKMRQDREEQE